MRNLSFYDAILDFKTEKPYKVPTTLKDWCANLIFLFRQTL
ncbi:hypothetical protein HBZC1_18200 [Helicobacter bizzozeronii CIII-1]|uniref:Uncharacterized protein n=1 Tax=Helicobacter bizzozeronii (strain CIII-1) TaxID=1002804 RepID=F8KQH7_HELBC|nr:hypothetical protein HBZC1_18200 [Helicobacter bizzozeronii CIII-1]